MCPSGILNRPSSVRQAVNRSRLLDVVRSPALITEVVADRGGYVAAQPVDWDV